MKRLFRLRGKIVDPKLMPPPPPPPPPSLLLDDYPGAAAAYSLRLLRTAYTGDCIRVRRSSDNTEQNIGFVNDVIDTASLLAFVGAGNGFVTTWYDQSGGGRNATQSTAGNQPRIVNSGTVDTIAGKPTVVFDGADDYLIPSNSLELFNNVSNGDMFAVTRSNSTASGNKFLMNYLTPGNVSRFVLLDGNTANRFSTVARRLDNQSGATIATTGTNHGTTSDYILTSYANWGEGVVGIRQNGAGEITANLPSSGNTSNTNSLNVFIGTGTPTTQRYDGRISEIVIYNTDQSANRSTIETNINNFYNVY